jgi:hypothetical protein
MSVYFWGLSVLAVLAGVYLGARLFYRKNIYHGEFCPNCGGSKFHRVHRHTIDKILGNGPSSARFRCAGPNCRWEGIRPNNAELKRQRKPEHRSRR